MSKITQALKKASEEKSNGISPIRASVNYSHKHRTGVRMRKSWWTWGAIVLIVAVFFIFNYQEGKDAVPLSEIFPDEEVFPVNVEYEFVQEDVFTEQPSAVTEIVEKSTPQINVVKEPAIEERQKVAEKKQEAIIKTETVAVKAPVPSMAAYTIQIASFKDKKRAEEALSKIRAKVPSAYIASRDLGSKGVWYRIYAGQFNARQEAEVSLSDIRQNYDSSFIISPKRTK